MAEKFWAVKGSGQQGFYTGTSLTRADAIAKHVHGYYRWTESGFAINGKLTPMQREDWEKCRRKGDRAVRVIVSEIGA